MRGWGAGAPVAATFVVVLAACAPTATEVVDDQLTGDILPAVESSDAASTIETTLDESVPEETAPLTTVEFEPAIPLPGPWQVVRVIDGDTLDLSDADGRTVRVRLIGINAPERGECQHDESRMALELITSGGGEIVLVPDLSDADRHGRKLRYLEVDGQDAGAALVRLGLAIARSYPPDTLRDFTYRGLQDEAEAADAGRWDDEACGATGAAAPEDVSIAAEVRYDAAGDDEQNLNDEWVRFTNLGGYPLDVEGWTVADESSRHRYVFGRLQIQPGASITLYTGCGVDSLREVFWCARDSAVWSNRGDTVFLRDALGNEVVAHRYTDP